MVDTEEFRGASNSLAIALRMCGEERLGKLDNEMLQKLTLSGALSTTALEEAENSAAVIV